MITNAAVFGTLQGERVGARPVGADQAPNQDSTTGLESESMAAHILRQDTREENAHPDLIPAQCRKCRAAIVREHHYVNRGVFLETLLCANEHLIQSKWVA